MRWRFCKITGKPCPHAVDPAPRAEFVLNDAAARLLESGGPPVMVSLEISGVSLLTNLRLLAAQAGMKVTFADSGAVLIPVETKESEAVKTAEWLLSSAVLETFSHASRRLRARHDPDSGELWLNQSRILHPVFTTRALSLGSKMETTDFTDNTDNTDRGRLRGIGPLHSM